MQIVVYSDFKMYFMLNILSWSFYTTYQKVTLQINQPLVKIGADILNASSWPTIGSIRAATRF